jgi:hypothetical protein
MVNMITYEGRNKIVAMIITFLIPDFDLILQVVALSNLLQLVQFQLIL